jgi:cytochrome c peroxidase
MIRLLAMLGGAVVALAADAGSTPAIRDDFDDVEVRRILQHSPLGAPPPTGDSVADDARAARLGQFLFFDARLSADGHLSCASCHDPRRGFADGLPLPTARGDSRPLRHTPSLWNVAYNRWYFWDGRADSLWAQALQPLESASELGSSRLQAAHLVDDDPRLRRAYERIFGPLPDLGDVARFPPRGGPHAKDPALRAAWEAMAPEARAAVERIFVDLGRAIAAYERRLVSRRAPFDVFAAGLRDGDETKLAALDAPARRGLQIFVGRGACRSCHGGPNFTDGEFHDTGVAPRSAEAAADAGRFEGARLLRLDPFNAAGAWSYDAAAADRLQYLAAGPESWGQLKTPSLRNVARTAPYMHQGQLATLAQVVDHYSTLRGAAFGGHHRETVLRPLALTPGEAADLVAFLESLTDEDVDAALKAPPASPELP